MVWNAAPCVADTIYAAGEDAKSDLPAEPPLALPIRRRIILPMTHADTAAAVFSQGFACSQAVLSAYAAEHGLDKDAALKVSAGFGGGMGRMAQTCGAVTGAYMVLGLKHGAVSGQDQDAKQKTCRLVREFAERLTRLAGELQGKVPPS